MVAGARRRWAPSSTPLQSYPRGATGAELPSSPGHPSNSAMYTLSLTADGGASKRSFPFRLRAWRGSVALHCCLALCFPAV